MSKRDYIERITSYLNDGFVEFPAGVSNAIEYNGTTYDDFKNWVEIAKGSLESIESAGKLELIPEAVLSNIVSYIEQIRNTVTTQLISPNLSDANSAFSSVVTQMEQLIYQTAPYLNLVDNQSYHILIDKVETILSTTQRQASEDKKASDKLKAGLKNLEAKSAKLLGKVSSGTLSKNFGELSNQKWNWLLMGLSLVLAVFSFWRLIDHSFSLTIHIISALENRNLDYKIFFAKWSTSVPYLFLLSVTLLELRNRIRARDTYLYRKSVAASLDGYTDVLMKHVGDITDKTEQSTARREVIKFMIDAMLELTKAPTNKSEKASLGFKVKDILEAKISSE